MTIHNSILSPPSLKYRSFPGHPLHLPHRSPPLHVLFILPPACAVTPEAVCLRRWRVGTPHWLCRWAFSESGHHWRREGEKERQRSMIICISTSQSALEKCKWGNYRLEPSGGTTPGCWYESPFFSLSLSGSLFMHTCSDTHGSTCPATLVRIKLLFQCHHKDTETQAWEVTDYMWCNYVIRIQKRYSPQFQMIKVVLRLQMHFVKMGIMRRITL